MPDGYEYLDDVPEAKVGGYAYVDDVPTTKQPKKKPTPKAKPVDNARDIVRETYPNAQITDWVRDPTSPLGRKNPDSWHNNSRAAVDTRAIPGMSFEEYVDGFRKKGYSILEARDEYKNPSGHATGPHWHTVLGGNPTPPAAAPAAGGYEFVDEAPKKGPPPAPPKDVYPYPDDIGRTPGYGTEQWDPNSGNPVPEGYNIADGLDRDGRPDVYSDQKALKQFTWWSGKNDEGKKMSDEAFLQTAFKKYPHVPDTPYNRRTILWYRSHYKAGGKNPMTFNTKEEEKPKEVPSDTSVSAPPPLDFGEIVVRSGKEMADQAGYGLNAAIVRGTMKGLMNEKDYAREVENIEEDRAVRDRFWNDQSNRTDSPVTDTIGKFVGAIGGDMNPAYLYAPIGGEAALGRIATQAGINAGIDVGVQNADMYQGVRDEYDPSQTAMSAAMGAAFQGGIGEPLGFAIKRWQGRGGTSRAFEDNPRVIEVGDTPTPSAVSDTPTKVRATKKSVGEEISTLTKGWENSPEFVVHASKKSMAKVEPDLWAKLREDNATKAPAFYADDGRIHVLADNVGDVAKVKSLVYHEALGHSGLANKFGDELNVVMTDLYKKNWKLRQEADKLRTETQYGEIYSADANPTARYVEEVLAKRSENGVLSKSILDKFIPLMRQYGRDMGLDLRFTDREVRAILADAHNTVVNGGTTNAGKSGMRYILTTHVSPHDFTNVTPENPHGAFDHSKMGTGEGAQVYGWGTYLGENTKDVYYSKFSRTAGDSLTPPWRLDPANIRERAPKFLSEDRIKSIISDFEGNPYRNDWDGYLDYFDRRIQTKKEIIAENRSPEIVQRSIKDLKELEEERAFSKNLIDALPERSTKPKTYEVDVPEEQAARMLQWDKSFDEQPQAVKDVVDELGIEHVSKERMLELEDERAQADDIARDYYEKNVQPIYDEGQRKGDALYEDTFAEIISSEESLIAAYNTFKDKLPGRKETMGRRVRDQGVFDGPSYKAKPLENLSVEEITTLVEDIAWRKVDRKIGDWTRAQLKDILPEYRRLAKEYDDVQEKIDRARYLTGKTIYEAVEKAKGSPKAASEYLAEKGIPGNKYADGFSRGKSGDKSYNYVMYNDKGPDAPKILNKYILPEDFGKATKQEVYESLRERFDPLPDGEYTYRGNGYTVKLDAIDNPDGKGLRLDRMFKLTEAEGETTGRLSYDWQAGNWVPTLVTSKNGKLLSTSEGLSKTLRVEAQRTLRAALPEKDVEGFHEAAKKLLSSNKYILPEKKDRGMAGSINLNKIFDGDGLNTDVLYKEFAKGIDRKTVTYEDAAAAVREVGMTPSRQFKKRLKVDPIAGISASVALKRSHNDILRLQRKMLTGEATGREEGQFAFYLMRSAAIQEKIANYRSDLGRAMNFLKIIVDEKGPLPKDFFERLNVADLSDRNVLYRIAQMMEEHADNPTAQNKIIRDQFTPFWEDYLISYRYSAMLYGLGTHVKNFVGNASMGLLDSASHLTAAGIGLRGKITGRERVTVRGATLRNVAMAKALFEVQTWKDVGTAWLTGKPPRQVSKVEVGHNLFTEKLGPAGAAIDAPQKALAASDSLWRSILENGQLYELALRVADKEKLRGGAMWDRVNELIANPTQEMKALADSNTATLQLIDDPSVFGRAIERIKSRPKNRDDYAQRVLRFSAHIALPFTRVTDNILRAGVRHTPLLGMLDRQNLADFKAGGARRDLALARQLVGATLIGYLINKVDNDELTGDGPADYRLKAQMMASGWRPNSIKLADGKWHSLDGFDAVMPMANVIAQTISHVKDKKLSKEDAASKMINLLAETGGNLAKNTFAKQAGDLFAMVGEGPKVQSARENYLSNLSSSLVPAGLRQYAEMNDGKQRDRSADGSIYGKIEAGIKGSIPGLRETLPVKHDVYGREMESERTLTGVNKESTPAVDKVITEVERLTVVQGKGALVGPATRANIPEELRDGATGEMVQAYQKLSGGYIYEDLKEFITSEDYKEMTDEERIDEIKAIVRDARADAKDELFPEMMETPPPSPQQEEEIQPWMTGE